MAQGSATGGSPVKRKVAKERPLRSVGGVTQTTVSATDLDIRDLVSATDSVTVGNAAASGVYVRPGTSAVFQVQSNSANVATETTLSAINTKMVTGTDIGDVTINNASGAAAVNIQDGGNTITVDGSVTVSATDLDIRDLDADDIVSANCRFYRSSDATYQPARLDKATNSIQTIDYSHHEIHAGSHFTCHYSNDVTAVGEQTGIAFNTPNTTNWIHMFATATSTGAAYFAIYETADLDVDEGTDLTIYNSDRNSATASTVTTVETTPEAGKATSYTETQLAGATLSTATEIYRSYIGYSGVGLSGAGGMSRSDAEFILKQNTQYCFVVNALTADDTTHNIILEWYEHINIA